MEGASNEREPIGEVAEPDRSLFYPQLYCDPSALLVLSLGSPLLGSLP